MKYTYHSHRNAYELFTFDNRYQYLWNELKDVLENITDEDLMTEFICVLHDEPETKSLSKAINRLIKKRLEEKEWNSESFIFADPEYSDNKGTWRLDFTKDKAAVEVAFNHGGNVSWNLIKPVLSSELNHVEKVIQTEIGIVITATDEMKKAGGFDGAVGSYEKYVEYCKPLMNILTTPILIIGLEKPETFRIKHSLDGFHRKIGRIEKIK